MCSSYFSVSVILIPEFSKYILFRFALNALKIISLIIVIRVSRRKTFPCLESILSRTEFIFKSVVSSINLNETVISSPFCSFSVTLMSSLISNSIAFSGISGTVTVSDSDLNILLVQNFQKTCKTGID